LIVVRVATNIFLYVCQTVNSIVVCLLNVVFIPAGSLVTPVNNMNTPNNTIGDQVAFSQDTRTLDRLLYVCISHASCFTVLCHTIVLKLYTNPAILISLTLICKCRRDHVHKHRATHQWY